MPRRPPPDRRPPLRVALTGGVASGKSTVAGLFALLGVPLIDMDVVAREVVEPGTPGLADLVERFGPEVLDASGALDRRALRTRIFADPRSRHELEALLHPLIRARAAELSRRAGGSYQLFVIPLLVETDTATAYDRVLVVDCDPALQLQRLVLRDRMDPKGAEAMLAAQAAREARLAAAHDVITNEGDLAALARQVEELHRRYLALAAARPSARPA